MPTCKASLVALALLLAGCRSSKVTEQSHQQVHQSARLALVARDSMHRVIMTAVDSPEIIHMQLDSPRALTIVRAARVRSRHTDMAVYSLNDSVTATAAIEKDARTESRTKQGVWWQWLLAGTAAGALLALGAFRR